MNLELANKSEQKTTTSEPEPEKEIVNETDNKAPEKTDKKYSKRFSPFFDTQIINGQTEEGLGVELLLKKNQQNPKTKFGFYGKISTTQLEESSQYHATLGASVKCSKKLNPKSEITVEAVAKDRLTFGHGNIVTAGLNLSYVAPKVTAELESKFINSSHSHNTNYVGVVGRVFYTPHKNVNIFAEGGYTNLADPDYHTINSRILAGIICDF